MSIENEIKKLNATLGDLITAIVALNVTADQLETSPTPAIENLEKVTVTVPSYGEESVVVEKEAAIAALPPITRKDLGDYLRNIALKYGTEAQDAIGKIVLEISGTQALSQVDDRLLPDIKVAVTKWVMVLEGDEAGKRG